MQSKGDVSPVANYLIRLEGQDVTDFSSQYGSESSISYVASNLAGKPCVFPSYGDYTQTCVFRTYGPWWKKAPSGTKRYNGTPSEFVSEDFIEISFSESLYPVRLEVYETYNPGAIVRILACDRAGGTDTDSGQTLWVTLWKYKPKPCPQEPRIFAPHLKRIQFATNLIRLELNHHFLDYYTELDGIKLIGTKMPPESCTDTYQPAMSNDADIDNDIENLEDLLTDHKTEDTCLADRLTPLNIKSSESCLFTILPKEIIHLILSYLDIKDLCRLAQTCRNLKMHCYDPYLYQDLNLQPFWTQISSSRLLLIANKCQRLQRLNLSWVGKGGHMNENHFKMFLKECCLELQTLELSCCNFVGSNVLDDVISICSNLIELNLHSCTHIEDFSSFKKWPLPKLKRLNLYRTKIDYTSLSSVIRASCDLEHLNLGSCQLLNSSINLVLMDLGTYSKKLKSLDLWRMKSLTEDALSHIYLSCHLLEELDIGWCVDIKSERDCYINLAKNCKYLKKIFLTANRTVRDIDLRMIALHCPLLEQLDILGTREVTREAIVFVLESCRNLILLDVSFCLGISSSDVCSWRAAFPLVTIKKSFQNVSVT
ncbi:F-box/LRR-repeat protein 4 [Biomphalaria glabrata]|nr:F-box/LRR-repeat protein 4-like [Biomphalaria glabrata]KAI8793301.1 F-box/LRR-repeat protein 4 [Biomphalaria glabrata]